MKFVYSFLMEDSMKYIRDVKSRRDQDQIHTFLQEEAPKSLGLTLTLCFSGKLSEQLHWLHQGDPNLDSSPIQPQQQVPISLDPYYKE